MCRSEQNKDDDEGQKVEEKLGRTTRYMHEVKEIGVSMKEEDLRLVKRRLVQIVAELQDIRDTLMDIVKDKLSPRQMSVLDIDQEELETDPSVQFFGIEWDSVFAKCFSLGLNIRIFKQRLEGGMVDSISLASILTELSKVEMQMEQHSIALLSGKLSSEQLSQQLQQQLRMSQVGKLARSNNTLEKEGEERRRRMVKYRKNKTENLTAKISVTRNDQRRKSSAVDFGIKKKTSFMDKVSSLLDYV
jgi:hypothetical protein